MTLGFSPCPNDTYIFYALANRKIDLMGLDFDLIIRDVEVLNQLCLSKTLDISKVSSHAYYYLRDDYHFLRAGAVFGRGCGPLIVANKEFSFDKPGLLKIGVPGKLTTAFLLMKLYIFSKFTSQFINVDNVDFVFMPFNEIMMSVKQGLIDAGLIIHEGRFTYQDYGLIKIADLGGWWESETGLPVPLGGIIAKKDIAYDIIKIIEDLISKSVEYSVSNLGEALNFIKKYSQELSDEVIMQHISLYVNSYSIDIGYDGIKALNELFRRAKKVCP